eukprot:CAMPEP_0197446648 /NCGR_PEP_ID=MMETSP1175-20131217/11546_1 /TAXON_ID=1003142 /ORGANISM="Triceratium dubium, Strain CCMP147" /LENGTH=42 /DNA_ID= /DNA_START= /DNA_END= /DNA_ORIENTATION=
MKLALSAVALIAGTAAAFAPSSTKTSSTAIKAYVDDLPGALA